MKKFRDMTDSEKLEIINAMIAGEPVEVSCTGSTWYDWKECTPYVMLHQLYRIPKRQMSIDWSVLNDEYICAVNDIDGNGFAYREKPVKCQSGWISVSPVCKLNGLKSYDPGTVDWKDSLIWRPGHEPK